MKKRKYPLPIPAQRAADGGIVAWQAEWEWASEGKPNRIAVGETERFSVIKAFAYRCD